VSRPYYERDRDLANEQKIVEACCRASGKSLHAVKLPLSYTVDWGIFHDDSLLLWAEGKRRFNERKLYPTFILSCRKYLSGMDLGRISGKPFVLIVEWNDGIFRHVCDGTATRDIRVGGRRDRGDWQDIEPVVHIPVEQFTEVRQHG
jgi:hypothetical protein